MFLIRTAFWLTLIILLLPTNEDDQRTVYGAAEAAIRDMSTFCTRNPEVCAKSRDAFQVFAQKAEFGARMVVDFVTEATSEQDPAVAFDQNVSRYPATYSEDSQNTLTEQDRELGWFGPSSKSGI